MTTPWAAYTFRIAPSGRSDRSGARTKRHTGSGSRKADREGSRTGVEGRKAGEEGARGARGSAGREAARSHGRQEPPTPGKAARPEPAAHPRSRKADRVGDRRRGGKEGREAGRADPKDASKAARPQTRTDGRTERGSRAAKVVGAPRGEPPPAVRVPRGREGRSEHQSPRGGRNAECFGRRRFGSLSGSAMWPLRALASCR